MFLNFCRFFFIMMIMIMVMVIMMKVWIKDVSYGERTKDNYGSPAFALINNATRKVLKHGKIKGHEVCSHGRKEKELKKHKKIRTN